MYKLRIGQLRAKPADRHAKFAGQKKLKVEPTVLPYSFFASSRSAS
jgi:hypothetical protein